MRAPAGLHITTGNRLDVVMENNKIVGLWHWPDGDEGRFIPVENPYGLLAVLQSTVVDHASTEPHAFRPFMHAYNACEFCYLPRESHADS